MLNCFILIFFFLVQGLKLNLSSISFLFWGGGTDHICRTILSIPILHLHFSFIFVHTYSLVYEL